MCKENEPDNFLIDDETGELVIFDIEDDDPDYDDDGNLKPGVDNQ